MAFGRVPSGIVGRFNGTPSHIEQVRYTVGAMQRADAGIPENVNEAVAIQPMHMAGTLVPFAPVVRDLPGSVVSTQSKIYHNRFWLSAYSYTLRDPEVGAVFSFTAWNTFFDPDPNELVNITLTDVSGVDFTVAPGYTIRPFQIDTLGFSINEDAPSSAAGTITFEFEEGDFSLGLIIERDTTLPLPPDYPWTETMRWETNVLTAEDSTEQRISLAATPEVTHSVTFTGIDNDETVTLIGTLLSTARNAPSVPFYHYLAALRADVGVGATSIEVKTQRGDVRVGDAIVIRNRQAISEPAKVAMIVGDVVTLAGPLQNAFKAGAYVIPAYEVTMDRSSPLARDRVESSKWTFSGRPRKRRYPFLSAQNTVTLATLGGTPVLDKRPLGNEQQNWIFDTGRRFAEYGRTTFNKDPWKVSFIEMPLSFLVDSFFTPLEWAFWRTFLDYCRGAQKPFLLPTYRPDLEIAEMPAEGGATLTIMGNQLSQTYMETGQLKGLRLVTEAGVHLCLIGTTEVVDETKETVTFDPPLPTGPAWANVSEISMIFLVRMKTDEVQVLHYPQHATVSFAVRTIKA
jgi:hypothetical protein